VLQVGVYLATLAIIVALTKTFAPRHAPVPKARARRRPNRLAGSEAEHKEAARRPQSEHVRSLTTPGCWRAAARDFSTSFGNGKSPDWPVATH